MEMAEIYGKVIDILAEDDLDHKAMCIAFAKKYPVEFCAVSDIINGPAIVVMLPMDVKIIELYRAGQKVEAIKMCRNEKGFGLKEAKDYCDALYENSCRVLTKPPLKTVADSW